ncbi:MAG: ABC transporter substrate-binding protein [bacterium]|nr:ABC transporter substrate-binding protein [bacterium]
MDLNNKTSRFNTGKLPTKEKINAAISAFSKKERVLFGIFVVVLLISSVALIQILNKSLMTEVPLSGGSISEGIVGTPRFINPVLGSSPADLDMVSLIYSGLMRKNAQGELIPDLALTHEESDDGLTHIFTLKEKVYFHNGEPVTADDVIFTIDRVKNSIITSPEKINWEGITAEKQDDRTVTFTSRQPNPNLLENATLGIMPKALWENDSMELNEANTMPIGSGPYMIKDVSKESSGLINSYHLVAFDRFALGKPYLRELFFRFYPNEEEMITALREGKVNQVSSISPAVADTLLDEGYRVESEMLPRVFGLFFNQNQNQLFLDKDLAIAIDLAIDKEKIVREVLFGYGAAIAGPIPSDLLPAEEEATTEKTGRAEVIEKVRDILTKDGWADGEEGYLVKTTTTKNKKTSVTLEFSISTGNAPELVAAAELIRQDLAAVGIKVDVKTFEVGNLNQSVIRPRKYDALLFGQVINRESDLYAFWHSSQRKDPGPNVAMYTNARADSLLEDAFITIDPKLRAQKYAQFAAEVKKDAPAVFLYSPDLIYLTVKDLKGLALEHIVSPSDRFNNIYSWFTKTENVWKIFAKN